jgi:hypothetical protein
MEITSRDCREIVGVGQQQRKVKMAYHLPIKMIR